jgi:hypothetical protein
MAWLCLAATCLQFSTRKVSGMLGLFSNKRVLIAFAILTAVLAIALLVVFNII